LNGGGWAGTKEISTKPGVKGSELTAADQLRVKSPAERTQTEREKKCHDFGMETPHDPNNVKAEAIMGKKVGWSANRGRTDFQSWVGVSEEWRAVWGRIRIFTRGSMQTSAMGRRAAWSK